MSRQSVVLLGIAAVFAAMLERMGWIGWQEALDFAALAFFAVGVVATGAAIIGLPLSLAPAVIGAALKLGFRQQVNRERISALVGDGGAVKAGCRRGGA